MSSSDMPPAPGRLRRHLPNEWACQVCRGEVFHMGFLGMREHGRCRACGLDQSRSTDIPEADLLQPMRFVVPAEPPVWPRHMAPIDPEDQILRDEEAAGLSPEELADGQAQFDATFRPIVTRPGESLIDTVREAREADEEEGQFEAPNNDMK